MIRWAGFEIREARKKPNTIVRTVDEQSSVLAFVFKDGVQILQWNRYPSKMRTKLESSNYSDEY